MRLRRTAALLLVLVLGGVLLGCGGPSDAERARLSRTATELLAEHPELPRSWTLTDFPGQNGQARPIDWVELRNLPAEVWECEDGADAFRLWQDGEEEFADPSVAQAVCVFSDEDSAEDVHDSLSFGAVAGPLFENESEAEIVPAGAASLDLRAEEWELGCGLGEANGICAVWVFRGRYGRAITDIKFEASAGGIRFAQMRALVQSVDRELAARAPR